MPGSDRVKIRFHEDVPLFRDALNYTAATTEFAPQLIEKDYFSTLLLDYLASRDESIVFKGGTCLAKVHANFYRLSEDLDFAISAPTTLARAGRSRLVEHAKRAVDDLPASWPIFRVGEPLRGASDSRQYLGAVTYSSVLTGQDQVIRLEIGLREPLVLPAERKPVRTLLINPISHQPMVAPLDVPCMSAREAFAEKFRAALSRRPAAVRDFFDVDYARRQMDLRVDADMIEMIRTKLSVPGNDPVDMSDTRLDELRRQVSAQLKPVLRDRDFAEFDLDRAFVVVQDVALRLNRSAL